MINTFFKIGGRSPVVLSVVLICLLGWRREVAAQGIQGLPADRYITSIPFQVLNGGIIIGQLRINSYADPLNFIFDTGCGGVSLDSATADHFHFKPQALPYIIRGVGGVRHQRLVDGLSLHVGGLTLDSLSMQVSDYDMLSCIYGEKIDGIIGYAFFSRYLVFINYDSSKMDVYMPGKIKYPVGGFLLRPYVAALPMLEGNLNETRAIRSRFYFDTGAGLCLLFSSDFAGDSAIFAAKKKKPVQTQAAGLGGKVSMRLTTLKTFSLGPFRFKQIPTYIFDDSYGVTAYPQLGGLIGNDLLRRFNLILNYGRSEIYILPNTSYHQPFDYGYSGVSIALIEGRVVVTDVMKDSPGEDAGLREGDIVLAINGNTHQSVQEYQSLLRTLGSRVKILVRHDEGGLAELSMKVRSIL